MARNWKITAGSYDPYLNQGQMSLHGSERVNMAIGGVVLDPAPNGEGGQQRALRKKVAVMLREAADFLDAVQEP